MRQALPVDLHLSVESIVEEQVVGHPHTVGLHGVTLKTTITTVSIYWPAYLSIVVIPNVRVIVVADLRFTMLLHPQSSLF